MSTARAGGFVNDSDIPPEVFLPSSAPAPAPAPAAAPVPPPTVQPRNVVPPPQPAPRAAVPPPSTIPVTVTSTATADPAAERLKALALQAKQRGDMAKAREYIIQLRVKLHESMDRNAKGLMIQALQSGTPGAAAASPAPAPIPVQRETYDNVPEEPAGPPVQLPRKCSLANRSSISGILHSQST